MPAPTHHPQGRPSRRRSRTLRAAITLLAAVPSASTAIAVPVVAVPAAVVASTLVAPAPASAANYTWTICRDGNAVGSAAARDRVTTGTASGGEQYSTPCATNNGNKESTIKGDQLTTNTTLSAPPGAKFTSMRINSYGNNYSYDNAWGYLYDAGSAYYRCNYYDQDFGGGTVCGRGAGGFNTQIARNFPLGPSGSSFLAYGIHCRSQTGCVTGTLDFFQRELVVTIDDTQGPELSVDGAAWTSGTLTGSPSLGYGVRDAAVGGKGLTVQLDGVTVADTRGRDSGGCDGDRWHKCPDDAGSVAISLAGIPDGQRSMQVIGYDDLENPSTPKTRSVLVDNVPPALSGATTLSGKAEQGEQLTCVAPGVDGQTPALAYAWYRSKADGSGKTLLPGETGTRYLQTASDIGAKISCSFSARDAGGTSTSESSITSGPFADGATVIPGKGPQPTGSTSLSTTGTSVSQPKVGDTLTIAAPDFPTGTSVAFAWFRCDATGQNCMVIPDATSSTYTLVAADQRSRIVGQVVATDASGTTTSRSEPTGLVTVAGSTSQGPTADSGRSGGSGSDGRDGKDGGGGTVVLAPGQANGSNACRDARLTTRFTSGSSTTVRFGKGATLRGKLICVSNGQPIAGAAIALTSRTFGRSVYTPAGVLKTDKNGQFTRALKKGAGRQLKLEYVAFGGDKALAASGGAMMYVRGRVVLKRLASTVRRSGGAIVFRGKLYGGGIPKNFKLNLEAFDGRRWRQTQALAVKQNGVFRFVYRCSCEIPNVSYRFRVKIPTATRLPYVTAASRAYRVRVR